MRISMSTLALATLGTFAAGAIGGGCSWLMGSGGSGGDAPAVSPVGEFEFTNLSGEDICSIEISTRQKKPKKTGFVIHTDRVANGTTIKLKTELPPNELTVAACDDQGLLAFGAFERKATKIALVADESGTPEGAQAVVTNWRKSWTQQLDYMSKYTRIKGPIQDESKLAKGALAAVKAKAAGDARWTDTPVVALVAGKHGDSGFPAYVGHMFPDGRCSVQAHWFTVDGDEVSYSRPYPAVGGSKNCAFVAWVTAQKGAAK